MVYVTFLFRKSCEKQSLEYLYNSATSGSIFRELHVGQFFSLNLESEKVYSETSLNNLSIQMSCWEINQ